MFWIPVAIFCTGILIGGETRRIWTWRICGAFACFFILWFLGIFKFYYALFGNAARSVFPNELYVEIQKWDNLTGLFSYGGGAIIFSILILASCIFLFFNSPRQLRYFSLAVGTYFCAMVSASIVYVYSGMRWNLPLPVYLEIGAAPAYAIIVILATHRAINLYFKNTKLAFQRIPQIAFVVFLPLFSASILGFIFILNPDLTKKPSLLASKESNGLVSKILAPNISIGPDGLFRGSVAMVAAVPGGEIMRRAGISSETPFQKNHILFLSRYLRSYDPHLYMTGLWEMRIPTLEDNSHLVTPPFYFLFSRALCRKQDFQSRNWTLCTSVQPNLMAALGARFLVSDLVIESPLLNKVATQSNSDGIPLYVYEFLKPNLAN